MTGIGEAVVEETGRRKEDEDRKTARLNRVWKSFRISDRSNS
jgi:hypothetical protein